MQQQIRELIRQSAKKARITELLDHCIEIPSGSTPTIQEGNIVIGHIIYGLIETQRFPQLA